VESATAQTKSAMFIYRITLLLLILQAGDFRGQDLRIDNNEVAIRSSTGSRQITHDGTPKRLPQISPDGKRIAYVADLWLTAVSPTDKGGKPEDIVETDVQGNIIRHVIPGGYVPVQFDRLEWIDNQRIGAMGCGNANCVYWILDAYTGKTLKMMEGGFDFIWSHNRRWVVRRFVGGSGDPSREHDRLMLNDEWVYPPRRESETFGHTLGESIAWSPSDAWVAFTDMKGPSLDNYVVIVSPSGVIMRDTIAGDVSFNAQIKWNDDTHLQVMAGGRSFNLAVVGNELRDVSPTL
jgi:hypothetical protein